jgi:hypothetical protein
MKRISRHQHKDIQVIACVISHTKSIARESHCIFTEEIRVNPIDVGAPICVTLTVW